MQARALPFTAAGPLPESRRSFCATSPATSRGKQLQESPRAEGSTRRTGGHGPERIFVVHRGSAFEPGTAVERRSRSFSRWTSVAFHGASMGAQGCLEPWWIARGVVATSTPTPGYAHRGEPLLRRGHTQQQNMQETSGLGTLLSPHRVPPLCERSQVQIQQLCAELRGGPDGAES